MDNCSTNKRILLRGCEKKVGQEEESSPVLHVEHSRLKQCIQFLIEVWVFPERWDNQLIHVQIRFRFENTITGFIITQITGF